MRYIQQRTQEPRIKQPGASIRKDPHADGRIPVDFETRRHVIPCGGVTLPYLCRYPSLSPPWFFHSSPSHTYTALRTHPLPAHLFIRPTSANPAFLYTSQRSLRRGSSHRTHWNTIHAAEHHPLPGSNTPRPGGTTTLFLVQIAEIQATQWSRRASRCCCPEHGKRHPDKNRKSTSKAQRTLAGKQVVELPVGILTQACRSCGSGRAAWAEDVRRVTLSTVTRPSCHPSPPVPSAERIPSYTFPSCPPSLQVPSPVQSLRPEDFIPCTDRSFLRPSSTCATGPNDRRLQPHPPGTHASEGTRTSNTATETQYRRVGCDRARDPGTATELA